MEAKACSDVFHRVNLRSDFQILSICSYCFDPVNSSSTFDAFLPCQVTWRSLPRAVSQEQNHMKSKQTPEKISEIRKMENRKLYLMLPTSLARDTPLRFSYFFLSPPSSPTSSPLRRLWNPSLFFLFLLFTPCLSPCQSRHYQLIISLCHRFLHPGLGEHWLHSAKKIILFVAFNRHQSDLNSNSNCGR